MDTIANLMVLVMVCGDSNKRLVENEDTNINEIRKR